MKREIAGWHVREQKTVSHVSFVHFFVRIGKFVKINVGARSVVRYPVCMCVSRPDSLDAFNCPLSTIHYLENDNLCTIPSTATCSTFCLLHKTKSWKDRFSAQPRRLCSSPRGRGRQRKRQPRTRSTDGDCSRSACLISENGKRASSRQLLSE